MESLSSLANTNCFYILQEKLNNWKYEFEHNCIEANISRCCELLELNARIQTQLFKLLGFCGIYGGLEGSEKKLKNQLLPYLGKDYFDNGLTSNIVIDILNDVGKQTKQYPLNKKNCKTPNSKNNTCPDERNFKQGIYDRLDELENIIMDLSSDSKVSYTKPVKKKKKHSLKRSTSLPKFTNDFNEISKSDAIVQLEPPGDFSGSDVEEIRNDTYLQGLVGRYNDLFSESRINAMDHLRQYNDDHENNQRILFALVMISARSVAEFQRSYRNGIRIKDRNEQIQQFRENISRSALKNLRTKIIYELINNRGNYFRFHVPQNLSFIELEGLINNTIHLFWNFGGAKNGLELMEASDGEMFDEHKYRRSYDSDFTAPLVSHHIWPCLMQNRRVLVKGEACTRSSNKMICSVQLRNRNVCSANNSISSLCSSK